MPAALSWRGVARLAPIPRQNQEVLPMVTDRFSNPLGPASIRLLAANVHGELSPAVLMHGWGQPTHDERNDTWRRPIAEKGSGTSQTVAAEPALCAAGRG